MYNLTPLFHPSVQTSIPSHTSRHTHRHTHMNTLKLSMIICHFLLNPGTRNIYFKPWPIEQKKNGQETWYRFNFVLEGYLHESKPNRSEIEETTKSSSFKKVAKLIIYTLSIMIYKGWRLATIQEIWVSKDATSVQNKTVGHVRNKPQRQASINEVRQRKDKISLWQVIFHARRNNDKPTAIQEGRGWISWHHRGIGKGLNIHGRN